MEWLLVAVILIAFIAATMWDSARKAAFRDRFANDHTITTVEKFLPEVQGPPG